MDLEYKEGDKVTIHGLGSNYVEKLYRGIVCGVSMKHITNFYIVEMVDKIDPDYPYTCATFPSGNLRKGWRLRGSQKFEEESSKSGFKPDTPGGKYYTSKENKSEKAGIVSGLDRGGENW